jgi:hypothetical protein
MPPKTPTPAATNTTIAEALDKINELAGKAELFEAHGKIGVLRVQIQELAVKAKAAL